jgi:hypothetical protein
MPPFRGNSALKAALANRMGFSFPPAPANERAADQPEGLSDVFDELSHNVNRDSEQNHVRLGVLLNAVGRRSYGPLLLIIGLFSISPATIVPGMTTLVAAVILLIALQMALGLQRPWLPKAMLGLRVPRAPFFAFIDKARPKVERIDGVLLKERLAFLAAPPCVTLVALCVAAAALITFPLSFIPFAPLAPGLAVVLFGLGMTARDGLWLSLGMVLTGGAFGLALPLISRVISG